MSATTTDRQARLKPESADRHPSLPVSMWTSAVRMAELVASEARSLESPGATRKGRLLSDAHFDFRGGAARRSSGSVLRWDRGEEVWTR
jgi:hypothetical protein